MANTFTIHPLLRCSSNPCKLLLKGSCLLTEPMQNQDLIAATGAHPVTNTYASVLEWGYVLRHIKFGIKRLGEIWTTEEKSRSWKSNWRRKLSEAPWNLLRTCWLYVSQCWFVRARDCLSKAMVLMNTVKGQNFCIRHIWINEKPSSMLHELHSLQVTTTIRWFQYSALERCRSSVSPTKFFDLILVKPPNLNYLLTRPPAITQTRSAASKTTFSDIRR